MAIDQNQVKYERAMTKLHETFPLQIGAVHSLEIKALKAAIGDYESNVKKIVNATISNMTEGASGKAADKIQDDLSNLTTVKISIN